MLKWLKQKPVDGPRETNFGGEMTTDDPLATIQVQQINRKKSLRTSPSSRTKGNDIYAVSRVNPLFEEDPKDVFSPGNHSGSSGYDSGGPSDDEIQTRLPGTGRLANGVPMPRNTPSLFSDKDDLLIHHEATMVEGTASPSPSPGGRPLLNIVKQNADYVKNISVAVTPPPPNRPLSPIAESGQPPRRVSAIPVPSRNAVSTKPGDSLGVAKVLQRSSNYVQSIRIGPSPARQASFARNGGYAQKAKSGGQLVLGRKPSVTFSERVDVEGSSAGSSRRSSQQDSIVTDSLLILTSSSNARDMDRPAPTTTRAEIHSPAPDQGPDLTTFSNSLSKNRMVKQIVSTSSSSQPEDDNDTASTRSFENHYDDVDHYNDECSEPSPAESQRRPRSVTTGSKSPFGGIADHYAAAKEIAKEIESYSTGTTKSTKISLVRDLLLSSRGRGGARSSSSPGKEDGLVLRMDGHSRTLLKTVVQIHPGSTGPSTAQQQSPHDRLQPQVYVKAKDNEELTTTTSPTPSPHHLRNSNPKPERTPHHDATSPDDGYHQDEGQDQAEQVPIYEALPGASRLRQDDSDSGNSTDRSPKEHRLGMEDPKSADSRLVMSTTVPTLHMNGAQSKPDPDGSPELNQSPPAPGSRPGPGSNDKVMIVSGDSQNMVVDLSGVPADLREAIISGTALVNLSGGLNQLLEPGYTMITMPTDHEYERIPPYPRKELGIRTSKDEFGKYGTKNKASVWDVIQSSPAAKGKRVTTVLPYHPNQDAHTTADFTLEGHRLARQTKRVKKLKTRRCICRVCGIIIFIIAFLGVIVTLSLVYTNGKHYFGSV